MSPYIPHEKHKPNPSTASKQTGLTTLLCVPQKLEMTQCDVYKLIGYSHAGFLCYYVCCLQTFHNITNVESFHFTLRNLNADPQNTVIEVLAEILDVTL